MIILLDTTALSAAIRHEKAMISFLTAKRPGEITTAAPVTAEIEYALHRLDSSSREYTLLNDQKEKLISIIEVLPWNKKTSVFFGSIKAELERKGQTVDDVDIAAAAIALENGAEVLTANLVQFRQISDLKSRHWTE